MADLNINFAGIKSPNPFWLASAPPTNMGSMIERAFDDGCGGLFDADVDLLGDGDVHADEAGVFVHDFDDGAGDGDDGAGVVAAFCVGECFEECGLDEAHAFGGVDAHGGEVFGGLFFEESVDGVVGGAW